MHTKYERILQLEKMGFNTPRMYYLESEEEDKRSGLLDFMNQHKHQNFVNVRTYKRMGEGWLSEHHLNVDKDKCLTVVTSCLQKGLVVMVDVENPMNGMFSGNVQIKHGIDEEFIVEYCHKPLGGAMVREADQHLSTSLEIASRQHSTLVPIQCISAAREAFNKFNIPYKTVILEWTWGLEPWGKKEQRLGYWEWRDKK